MGKFVYGTGVNQTEVGMNDWFLAVLEEVVATGLQLRRPFRIRFNKWTPDDSGILVVFITDGVPIRFIYDSSVRPQIDEKAESAYSELREQLERTSAISIGDDGA